MKKNIALVVIATFTLFLTLAPASASADSPHVQLTPAAPEFAAGSDALFEVKVSAEAMSPAHLDYAVEGGEIVGAVSIMETGEGQGTGGVYVRRDTPGEATLVASHDGTEVARATATFVPGASVTLTVTLDANGDAAARTWFFNILDDEGRVRGGVHVGTSGAQLVASSPSQPVPYGDYTVRLATSSDVAATCESAALFAVEPAQARISVDAAGASAAFTIRICGEEPVPAAPEAPTTGGNMEVRSAPLPPATGGGKAEQPKLPDSHAAQLVTLALLIVLLIFLSVPVVRLLAHVAPVKKARKARNT